MRGDTSDNLSERGGVNYHPEAAPWLGMNATESQARHHLAWRSLQLSKAKLKANSRTSGLLSGFAMIAMIELNVAKDDNVPNALLVAFTVSASLLVAVHILALMISTCILPNLESYSTVYDHNIVLESPHEKMRTYIEMAWIFSTGLGILLFLVVVVLACWVKFWRINQMAAMAATITIGPVVIIFIIFAVLFYRQLISHKFQHATNMMDRLDTWMQQLDENTHPPVQTQQQSGSPGPIVKTASSNVLHV